jgi:hypothetical protein
MLLRAWIQATYQIVVEAAGFKRFSREGIVVGTQQSVTVDVALSVGDIAQTVRSDCRHAAARYHQWFNVDGS